MVIFIKVRGNRKNAWHAGALTEKGTGPQNSVCGIFGRKATVLRRGTISLSQDDISFIAFINQHRKLAKTFIIHFNLEASPTAAAEQHSSNPLSQAASGNPVADRRQPLRLELTLHGALDDATGTVGGTVFYPTEKREGISLSCSRLLSNTAAPRSLQRPPHHLPFAQRNLDIGAGMGWRTKAVVAFRQSDGRTRDHSHQSLDSPSQRTH